MQPLGRQHMRLDQPIERPQRRRAGADLAGERRDAELDPFPGEAFALPVQRLVLGELVEQDRGEELWAGKAARRDVEGWKGAGGCEIRSQSRQLKRSRTIWITFHRRGTSSSVSITS